jgi:hypothetical protein
MGCDIHMYRERLIGGKWETADEWDGDDVDWEKRFTRRNYNLFAILAGVREREAPPFKFEPRGLPINVSPEVKRASDGWDCYGHSHSHLYLHELEELRRLLREKKQPISGMKNRDELAALKESIASGSPDWILLYPYCQGTNDPKQVEFCIDVPSDFMVGAALDEIIEMTKAAGGEMQRVVFWFDN